MKYLWKLLLTIYWGYFILFKIAILIVVYVALVIWNFSLKEANEELEEYLDGRFFWFPITRSRIDTPKKYYKSIPDLWNSKVWEETRW